MAWETGSIPGRDIPKTQDFPLLNTQHYKIQIKGKVEQSRRKSSALLKKKFSGHQHYLTILEYLKPYNCAVNSTYISISKSIGLSWDVFTLNSLCWCGSFP